MLEPVTTASNFATKSQSVLSPSNHDLDKVLNLQTIWTAKPCFKNLQISLNWRSLPRNKIITKRFGSDNVELFPLLLVRTINTRAPNRYFVDSITGIREPFPGRPP